MAKWIKSKYPGVRYYVHSIRKKSKTSKLPDCYWSIRHTHLGKTVEEGLGWSSRGMSEDQAGALLAEIKRNQKSGSGPTSAAEMQEIAEAQRLALIEAERVKQELPQTFNDLADLFVNWAELNKPKSWSWDQSRLAKYIRPRIGTMQLKELQARHVEALKESLQRSRLSAATIVHCLGLVRRCYNHGRHLFGERFRDVAPQGSPTVGVAMPKLENKRTRYLSLKEAELLMQVAQKSDPLMHDIIYLALYTGLRRQEVITLKKDKIDLKSRIIHIPDSLAKSGQNETVEVPGHLVELLQDRIADKEPWELVYPSSRTQGQLKSISPRFKKIVDQTTLNTDRSDRDRVTFHTLRHTYISWLVIDGVDLATVQSMARHCSIEMTMRYAHLAPSSRKTAAGRLPAPGSKILPFPGSNSKSSANGSGHGSG